MNQFKEGALIGFIIAAQYFLPPLGGIAVAASLVSILVLDYHARKTNDKLIFLQKDVLARLGSLELKVEASVLDSAKFKELDTAVSSLRNVVLLNKRS